MKMPDIEKLKSAGRHHWFFSTFAEQRRDYAHIGLAAALVNVLALGSSFFIMIVYDRIIPNDATESLVALLIGMLIVLIFDFLTAMERIAYVYGNVSVHIYLYY